MELLITAIRYVRDLNRDRNWEILIDINSHSIKSLFMIRVNLQYTISSAISKAVTFKR